MKYLKYVIVALVSFAIPLVVICRTLMKVLNNDGFWSFMQRLIANETSNFFHNHFPTPTYKTYTDNMRSYEYLYRRPYVTYQQVRPTSVKKEDVEA